MTGFTGTAALLRLAPPRDRVQVPVWLLALAGVMAASAASVIGLYDSEPARLAYAAASASSPVALAFNGPTSGTSTGAIVVVETVGFIGVLLALMTTFTVVRHTRQNEENGRAELLAAAPVGRYAPLSAAVLFALLANGVVGVLVAAALGALGLPAAGSVLTGVALALGGAVFAGVAAVAAQLTESARAANGLAAAAVGVSFLARAAGDAFGTVSRDGLWVASAWPSWVSPLGWAQQSRPFAGDHWLVPALPLAGTAALVAVAFSLSRHRDVGTGMLPIRRGPARGPATLTSPLGPAWRLQRAALFGWIVGVAVLGVAFGAVAEQARTMMADNPDMAEVMARLGGAADPAESFLGAMLSLHALAVTGYVVQALLRMRIEESTGHAEAVLATPVSRTHWLVAQAAPAFAGGAVLLLVAGLSTAAGHRLTAGAGALGAAELTGAALARLPAVAVLGALLTAVFGLLPRYAAAAGWGSLAACALVLQVGALLELPQPVRDLSPFTHVPSAPAASVTPAPLWWLTVLALGLAAVGALAFTRRDLTT